MTDTSTDETEHLNVADELEVEQEHFVHDHNVRTHTDVHVPNHVDAVSEQTAQLLWDEFGIEAEDEGLEVVPDE